MSTNFLPLPSGGFIASQPKPCYTLSRLPTLINYISNLGFYQGIFALDKISLLYNTINTKPIAASAPSHQRIFLCLFHGLTAFRPQGSLKGIRLLIIAETVRKPVRAGRSIGRGNSFGFFICRNTKPIGGALWHQNKTASAPEANPTGAKALRLLPTILKNSILGTSIGGQNEHRVLQYS